MFAGKKRKVRIFSKIFAYNYYVQLLGTFDYWFRNCKTNK